MNGCENRVKRTDRAAAAHVRRLGIAVLLSCAFPAGAAERVTIEVREPYGISRQGYPVSGLLVLPREVPSTASFRLLRDGEPVVAQFRPDQIDGASARWWLDFVTELAPFGRREYVVEYGNDVEQGPVRSRGHRLIEAEDTFVVSNAPYIDWTVPRDLEGLLRSVDFPPSEHLRPDSAGLMLRDADGNEHAIGGVGTSVQIIRNGSMAVALRFAKEETRVGLDGVRWTADLIFPVPVSWVEVVWNLQDPNQRVADLGMQLNLNLDPPTPGAPTLVDFGASETVYTSLAGEQEFELRARPLATDPKRKPSKEAARPWEVWRGPRGALQPFVLARDPSTAPAEGWAHVMDRKRCLALALGGFARRAEERIHASADGTISVWRRYSAHPSHAKTLRAWLHFVHYPPQYSAGASPQAMQHPIELRVIDRR